jgi:hypothetical protein
MAVHRGNLSSLYAVEHALERLRRQTAESLAPQSRQLVTKPASGISRASKDSLSRATKKSSPKKHARLPASSSEDLMDRRPAPDEMCAYISDDGRGNGAECRSVQADPIHDKSMGYGGYHPFQLSSAAHSAQPPSSANGGESGSTANPERGWKMLGLLRAQ